MPKRAEPDPVPTDTQRRLVDAAVGLFAERGFDGVSTAEIAARAGVAEKTLFANFGSKERLYQAALGPATVWAMMVPEALRTLAPVMERPFADLPSLLRAILSNRIHFARQHPRELKLLAQHLLLRPEGIDVITAAWTDRMSPLVMPLIDRLVASGQVRDDVPALTAVRFIVTTAIGYVLTSVVLRPDLAWDDAREVEDLVKLLSGGLVPREKPARARRPPKRKA
jgi:AcrR family transcriptional regulator